MVMAEHLPIISAPIKHFIFRILERLRATTQVVPPHEQKRKNLNLNDRVIHSVRVSELASTITSMVLTPNQDNFQIFKKWVDAAKIAGLFHDIGHAPFGHAGEEALNMFAVKYGISWNHGEAAAKIARKSGCSVETVAILEAKHGGNNGFSDIVHEYADDIAWMVDDLYDAVVILKLISLKDLLSKKTFLKVLLTKELKTLTLIFSYDPETWRTLSFELQDAFIDDLRKNSYFEIQTEDHDIALPQGTIRFSKGVSKEFVELKKLLSEKYYQSKEIKTYMDQARISISIVCEWLMNPLNMYALNQTIHPFQTNSDRARRVIEMVSSLSETDFIILFERITKTKFHTMDLPGFPLSRE